MSPGDFFQTYVTELLEILAMQFGFFRFLGKIPRYSHCLLLCLSGIALLGICPAGSLFQFGTCFLLLAVGGILTDKANYRPVIAYAVITVQIMRLCFGVSGSLCCILSPWLFPQAPQTAGFLFMTAGNVLALSLSVFCYHMIHKYLQPGKSLNTQYSQFMILPAFMIFLAGEYSGSAVYENTLTLDAAGRVLNAHYGQILMIQLLSAACLFSILFGCKKLADSFELNMKLSLLEQETHSLRQYVEEARTSYENTASFRHDIKNHISIVRELLRNSRPQQALSYIGDMETIAAGLSFPCNTNNPVLDILLKNKLGIAKSSGIKASCSLRLPYPCSIPDMDFCILLSNALDNAVQACRRLNPAAEKYICISGRLQGDFILLEIKNSMEGSSPIRTGTGLKNIRTVAEKYHGAVSIKTQNGEFSLSILLILPHHADNIPQQSGSASRPDRRKEK